MFRFTAKLFNFWLFSNASINLTTTIGFVNWAGTFQMIVLNEKMSYTETRLSLSFNLAKVSVQ